MLSICFINRIRTETAKETQDGWSGSGDWSEIEGILIIVTPYAGGFDHFLIADEVQFKFERCLRYLKEIIGDLPTFGIGHSLGSVIHLLIGWLIVCALVLCVGLVLILVQVVSIF
ncbi:hypothetical protein ACS0TY_036685 [Phlomoides rotata]